MIAQKRTQVMELSWDSVNHHTSPQFNWSRLLHNEEVRVDASQMGNYMIDRSLEGTKSIFLNWRGPEMMKKTSR